MAILSPSTSIGAGISSRDVTSPNRDGFNARPSFQRAKSAYRNPRTELPQEEDQRIIRKINNNAYFKTPNNVITAQIHEREEMVLGLSVTQEMVG